MPDPNKKQRPALISTDPEWEQEKPIWDASENEAISDDDSVSLDEFKALIAEIIEDEEVTSDENG
jgi:hypothetical protein